MTLAEQISTMVENWQERVHFDARFVHVTRTEVRIVLLPKGRKEIETFVANYMSPTLPGIE